MKKKNYLCLFLIVVFLLLLLGIFLLGSTTLKFSVKKSEEAGLNENIRISTSRIAADKYSGNIYLPGEVNVEKAKLFWTRDKMVTVKVGEKEYCSGEAPLPKVEKSISYVATNKWGNKTTYKLKLYKGSTSVSSMFINIDDSLGTFRKMNIDNNKETSCYGTCNIGGNAYDVSIKGRGNSTWHAEKKPYSLSFYKKESTYTEDEEVALIKGVKSDKWNLLANYTDSTLLRNKIGYDLAESLGVGLKSKYYDLWIDGTYFGNYLVTEKVSNAISKNGYQMEIDNFEEPSKSKGGDPQFRLDGLEETQCFRNLITVKKVGKNAEAAMGENYLSEIQSWMQTMLDAVMDYNSDEYRKYIDVDSWAKVYLIYEFSKNYDSIDGSIYMHRDGLDKNDKLIAGPIWDLDCAFGRTVFCKDCGVPDTIQFSGDGWYINSIKGQTAFLQYLGKHDDFMRRVYELYNENYSAWNSIENNIINQSKLLKASRIMNFNRWDINQSAFNNASVPSFKYGIADASTYGTYPYDVEYRITINYDSYYTNFYNYVSKRLKYLKDNLYGKQYLRIIY